MYNFDSDKNYSDISYIEIEQNDLVELLNILRRNHYTFMVEDYFDDCNDIVRVSFMYHSDDDDTNISDMIAEEAIDDTREYFMNEEDA